MIAVPKPKKSVVLPKYRTWIRRQPCLCWAQSGCQKWGGQSEAAHIRPRRYCDDAEHLIPLCHTHHMAFDQDQGHLSFPREYGLHVKKTARELYARYLKEIDQ